MKYVSLFSGIEAATVAWEPFGWMPVAYAEIDPFPKAVLAHHYPDVPDLGDMTKVDWEEYRGTADIVVGGSPCFPAGTLVLTSERLKPIEEVKAGDMVLTHRNRWRRVLSVGSKQSDTIILRGQGVNSLECTANHPFLSDEKHPVWDTASRSYKRHLTGEPTWVQASAMEGRFWLNLNASVESLPVPTCEENTANRTTFDLNAPFFYFVGRWLGDGWANIHMRRNRVNSPMKRTYVCCSRDSAEDLESKLADTGLHWGRSEQETTTRFTCSSTALYDWLVDNFGVHAEGKNLPAWVFGMNREWREQLFLGYMESDGMQTRNGYSSTSINRRLCIGMKMLASGLGYAVSMIRTVNKRSQCVIDGRRVNERPYYRLQYTKHPRSAVMKQDGFWGLVRGKSEGRRNITVYNMEVEDDHSYTADGIAVHNCQAFSIAGLRKALDDPRGQLMLEYLRACHKIDPEWIVWENVPGVLSADKGRAFGSLLAGVAELWPDGGAAWRVLDAQFYGVAQRRRRVFLVINTRDWRRAAPVLFERESLQWDYPSSREARKAIARRSDASVGEAVGGTDRCGAIAGNIINRKPGNGGNGPGYEDDGAMYTLTASDVHGVWCTSDSGTNMAVGEDVSPTLTVHDSKNACFVNAPSTCIIRSGKEGGGKGALVQRDMSGTLTTGQQQTLFAGGDDAFAVRRLTPVECERLQGFPDGYTDVPWRGADHAPDSKRYKALGNSMAVPVMRWIGEGIRLVNNSKL
ncbi:DNA (cytosine-5-)-methyltransferase [Pseudoscardovia suis]|uniref:DNA (cytosine-5-)-methyltransferase n=1 Tax=Pseudoscardovia suis TaxID=987063 RepID=A0A261EPU1_9BIFI|nr:DNA (cytosine-5-)-methyltransferase [Pseudoscardovia suis]OZG48863.1 DNA-cytosine methyltransferase [Pseudoscardovia suis]PJJ63919.1 DNA-cytosine methyltransferase [Pseudoscardovia suis]